MGRVKFLGEVSESQINWGGHTDPRGLLEKDKEYDVDDIEVHSWHTRIYLKGINGYFNSVWFEKIEI